MRKSLIAVSILLALGAGFAAGWFAHPQGGGAVTNRDDYEAWANVPSSSASYATAQRLLGWNYFAQEKHDLAEAKRHVDLALATSPNDPKVLEDAGRVYVLAGHVSEGTAMLKKADTPIARDFLAHRQGT